MTIQSFQELLVTNYGLLPSGYTGSQGATGFTGSAGTGGSGGGVPKITGIQVTNSSGTVLDDTAVDTAGGHIRITGSGFESGCQVMINNVPAAATTFVSATQVRAQVAATAAGTYVVYLVNSDGGVAIRLNGITFSATPVWITSSVLAAANNIAFSTTLNATNAVSYQVQPESLLPAGLTLAPGGLLSGTLLVADVTVYNFTIDAIDAELQNSARTFALTVSLAQELFVPEGTTLLLGFKFNNGQLTKSGSLATTLQQTLTYQTSGGIAGSGYATGWSISNGINIDGFTTGTSPLNKTYVAWYRGTQTSSVGSYSPSVPIFSDPSNSVYWGFGLSDGKISIANGAQQKGTTNIATNQWFCLAWTVSGSGSCNGFVNGVREVTNISVNTNYFGPLKIGSGYNYTGTEAPTALDAIQIFDGVLSDSQIASIYTTGA